MPGPGMSQFTFWGQRCCSTEQTWLGPIERVHRGRRKMLKTSRKVFHVRGVERFWHWKDQTSKLAAGYGYGR